MRKVIFSLIPLLILLLGAELFLRTIYFQMKCKRPAALYLIYYTLRSIGADTARKKKVKQIKKIKHASEGLWEAVFGERRGHALLTHLENEYENHFIELAKACASDNAKLIVLYIPSIDPASPKAVSQKVCRTYYKKICLRHAIPFVDTTDAIMKHSWVHTSHAPADDHYSRFGYQVVAEKLLTALEPFSVCQTNRIYNTPQQCGDFRPNENQILEIGLPFPYRVTVNREGFRNIKDVSIPKTKQRILVLGDSFTFGSYCENPHTYPLLLQKMNPNVEVLNAGQAGYTIEDEKTLYIDRARNVAPDIVVLQVLDNDLYGLLWFRRNEFDRRSVKRNPSDFEKEFFSKHFTDLLHF